MPYLVDTIELLKINKRLQPLVDFIEEEKLAQSSYFVHRLGCEDEYSADTFDKLKSLDEDIGYLSTMIIRVSKEGNS